MIREFLLGEGGGGGEISIPRIFWVVLFLWVGRGVFKKCEDSWSCLGIPARVVLRMLIVFLIFFVSYHLMLGIFKARKYGMGFLAG